MEPFSFLGMLIIAIIVIFLVRSVLHSMRFLFFFLLAVMLIIFFFGVSLTDIFRGMINLLLAVF